MNLHCIPFASLCASLLLPIVDRRGIAQDRPDPAVQALLQKIDTSRGQPTAKPRSLTIRGTYSIAFEGAPGDQPVAKGRFEEWFVGADLARHRSDMGEFGALERGIRGDLVWEVDPAMGAKVHRGAHASAVRRYCAAMAALRPQDLFTRVEAAGEKPVDDRPCTVLSLVPKEGKPDRWYVAADGRVVRIDTHLPAPEAADAGAGMDDLMPATITFGDWRKVDGATLPFARTLRMGPATVAFTCSEIVAGAEIDRARFTPPDAIAKAAEKPPEGPAFDADGKPNYRIVERKAQPVASIRIRCKPNEISKQLAILLPEVMTHLNAVGARMAGAPFSRYHAYGPDGIDLEAGIPVQAAFEAGGRVANSELPAGRAVTCWHVGPYEKLSAAHAALAEHLAQQKLEASGGPWEVYWTDPGMVPDPAKWRTQLFAPVN